LRLRNRLTNIKIQEDLIGAVIEILVPLPFAYIRYAFLLKKLQLFI